MLRLNASTVQTLLYSSYFAIALFAMAKEKRRRHPLLKIVTVLDASTEHA